MASVKVAVRVRPLNKRECNMNCSIIVAMDDNTTTITNAKIQASANESFGKERVKQFTYDFSYWSVGLKDDHYISQEKVYEDLGRDVVGSAYQGYNACVFAYGQTGSGKTHTMMGSAENYGLIPRICQSLFEQMQESKVTYRTEVSYLEIYNERVRDLLRGHKDGQQNLRVREHPKEGPYVQDLSKHLVVNYDNVQELIIKGNTNRTTATTNMNDESSRSHAIFTICFTQARFDEGTPSEIHSKINLVDLAGSERSDMAGTIGERLKEGSSINKSLVTLGSVISALADSSVASALSPHSKALFIPYRNSVLTWLLKDSLGGNAKTIMIATISPADCNYAETLSTLRYASRAKKIVNRPTINEDPNVKLIRELREENARLRALLEQQGNLTAMQEQLNRNEEKVKQLTDIWADKWQEAASILREHKMLALRKEGMGVILDSDLPYLLAIDDNILSTGMKLYHIKEGETRVGREDAGTPQDIELEGAHIEAEHCIIRHVAGEVELVPLEGARCCINNVSVDAPTKLSQGAIISLGRRHLFRFNHPREAAKMRQEYRGSVVSQLASMMQDIHMGCSSLSISDSALGSDLDLRIEPKSFCESCEKLEEHRRRREQQEQDHLIARSQSLPRLSDNEVQTDALQYHHHLAGEANIDGHLAAEANHINGATNHVGCQNEKPINRKHPKGTVEQVTGKKVHQQHLVEEANTPTPRQVPSELSYEPKKTFDVQLQPYLTEGTHGEGMVRTSISKNSADQDMHSKTRPDGGTMGPNIADDYQSRNSHQMSASIDMDDDDMMAEALADSLFDVEDLKLHFDLSEPSVPSSPVTDDMKCLTLDITAESLLSLMDDRPLTDWTVEDLDDRLSRLSEFIHQLHARVCCVLQRKYGSVLSSKDLTSGLSDEVIGQFVAIRPVFDKLEKLIHFHTRETELADQLSEYNAMLQTADTFLRLHHLFQDLDLQLSRGAFTKVIEGLATVHALLASLEAEQELERNVITVFHTEACILREKSLFEVSEVWKVSFRWTFPSRVRKRTNRAPTTLELCWHSDCIKERLQCAVQAMHTTGMLESRLKTFSEAIVSNFVKIAVSDRSAVIEMSDTTDTYIVHLVTGETLDYSSRQTCVPPAEAFQKLEQLFRFLHTALSGIVVTSNNSADNAILPTLIEQIGDVLTPKLFDCVYTECLSLAVPRCGRQWDIFCDIMSATERFQATLMTLRFMSPRHRLLTDYLSNVKVLFTSIKSEGLLRQAHDFVTHDLLMSAPISGDHPLGYAGKPEDEATATGERESFVKTCREEAGTVNYRLPNCRVSDPVRRLTALAYDTLREALAGSRECAVHLSHSVHRMFDLYCEVVPSHHGEKLSTLPLLAALHHNNCMFVAHHLITVDKMFQRKQAVSSDTPANSDTGYVSQLVAKSRKAGNEAFTGHINATKGRLRNQLGGVETFECVADDDGAGATAAVTHMLDHLRHISTVWRNVLPTNTYCRAIGSLLNAALTNIIYSVMSIEEFSVNDCDHLHSTLSLITAVAADYFHTETSSVNPQVTLHECVPNWLRFKELVLFLDCGLQAVADRWADGKGPLALHLTATEVRRLVIAVFENTRKRDLFLSRLKL